jgi:hypothetical protein
MLIIVPSGPLRSVQHLRVTAVWSIGHGLHYLSLLLLYYQLLAKLLRLHYSGIWYLLIC